MKLWPRVWCLAFFDSRCSSSSACICMYGLYSFILFADEMADVELV